MSGRGKLLSRAAVVVIIGSIGLINVSRNPRFEHFHTVDILQMIASGVCFGVALFLVMWAIRGPREPQS